MEVIDWFRVVFFFQVGQYLLPLSMRLCYDLAKRMPKREE